MTYTTEQLFKEAEEYIKDKKVAAGRILSNPEYLKEMDRILIANITINNFLMDLKNKKSK